MTNEEIEKRMEFIIEQQARFASDIQQSHERQAQVEEILVRLSGTMSDRFREIGEKIDALVNAQVRTDDALARTDEAIQRLTEAQARTDEKLSKLAESQDRTDDAIQKLTESQVRTDQAIQKLAETQARTDQALSRTEETVRKLSDNQAQTDHALKNLIAVVDRYFRQGGNGQKGQG